MLRFIVRRLFGAIPTLLVIIAMAFFMMRVAPGGPFDQERNLPPEIEFHVVPPLCPLSASPMDFSMTGALIERAEASTRAWIADGGLTRRDFPHQMVAHKHG